MKPTKLTLDALIGEDRLTMHLLAPAKMDKFRNHDLGVYLRWNDNVNGIDTSILPAAHFIILNPQTAVAVDISISEFLELLKKAQIENKKTLYDRIKQKMANLCKENTDFSFSKFENFLLISYNDRVIFSSGTEAKSWWGRDYLILDSIEPRLKLIKFLEQFRIDNPDVIKEVWLCDDNFLHVSNHINNQVTTLKYGSFESQKNRINELLSKSLA